MAARARHPRELLGCELRIFVTFTQYINVLFTLGTLQWQYIFSLYPLEKPLRCGIWLYVKALVK